MAHVANLVRTDGKAVQAEDFLTGGGKKQEQSPQQMAAVLNMWVGVTAGKKGKPRAQ